MSRAYRWTCGGVLATALIVTAAGAPATNAGCEQALHLQRQGLSIEEIAQTMGLPVAAVNGLCAEPAPRSVVVPNGRVPSGAAGPAPLGAAGPAPLGAAGPAPLGAAGPAPLGAAGPAPMGAAGAARVGAGTSATSNNQIQR